MDFTPTLVGISLISIELIRSIPALQRVKKHENTDGISGTSLGVLAGTSFSWLILAFLIQSWWVLAANMVWLIIHLLLCRAVSQISPQKKVRIMVSALICFAVLVMTCIVAGILGVLIPALNILVILTALFYGLPALYEGLKSKTTQGLSVIALSVNSIEGIIYLLAGIGVLILSNTETPILGFIFFGSISILCNGVRLIRVIYRRARGLDKIVVS